MRRPSGDRLRGRTGCEGIKRDGRCARDSASSSPPLSHSPSLSLSFPRSPPPLIPLLFQRCPSDTLALNLPTALFLYLSPSHSPPPFSRLPVPRSLYPVYPSRSHPPRPSRSHSRTSAFLSAKRRTGFRRKETTIRRIVATDHSWRVDRINRSELAAATNRIARDTQVSQRRALRVPSDLCFFFVPSPRHRG